MATKTEYIALVGRQVEEISRKTDAMRQSMSILETEWRKVHGDEMPVQELDHRTDPIARAYRILEKALG